MTVIKNKTTPENQAYWEHVESVAAKVAVRVPAATGSGAACPCHGHLGIIDANCGWCPKPTPPASQQPTVTLNRETFDKVVGALERTYGRTTEVKHALALLRAAEQK